MANEKTYYPELLRKTKRSRIKDNLLWFKNYGEINEFYCLYGMDIVGSNADAFVDYQSFKNNRNRLNHIRMPDSQSVLLRDKLLFFQFLTINGIRTPSVFAFLNDGALYSSFGLNCLDNEELIDKKDYFIKQNNGECASYVKYIGDYDDYLIIKDEITRGGYILQEKIYQHEALNSINNYAINTLRIITVKTKEMESPIVLSSVLRMGTEKTGSVDNWAAGGISIGVNKDGSLKKFGFYKPGFGGKTASHPNSGTVFSNCVIPFFDEAVELVCKAHKIFYNIHSIGWDVAITQDGPIIIEGNDNWEISLMQACDRPLKKEWSELTQ